MPPRILLLCIGNTLRSDDGAAHALGQRFMQRQITDLHVLFAHQLLPEHAMEAADVRTVIIADASLTADTVYIEPLPAADAQSTATVPVVIDAHAMLPQDLAAMCALLGGTHTTFHLLHIPARNFAHGEQLSATVAERVREAEDLLVRFITDFTAP